MCDPIKLARSDPGWLLVEGVDRAREREIGLNRRGRKGRASVPAYRPARASTEDEGMAQTVREKALIRQAREDGRPSEDDVAQDRLGWRGQKGRPPSAMMTEDSKLQTPSHLDPGHTA